MHTFLRSLIASVVLAHALIGCCAHEESHTFACRVAKPQACGHDDHAADEQQESVPDTPDKCGRCNCHWLVGGIQPVELDSESLRGSFCTFVYVGDVLAPLNALFSTAWRSEFLVSPPHAPGLRAHLAMGVLLL